MKKAARKKTIECLPDEVHTEILSYLSPNQLKVSAFVCKRWNNLMSNTSELMGHYRLSLDLRTNFEDAMKVNRKFLRASVSLPLTSLIQEILRMHNLRVLELSRCTIDRESFAETLRCMENLETLSIVAVSSDPRVNHNIEPVQLSKLKTFSIKSSDIIFLNSFSAKHLTSFAIDSSTHAKGFAVVGKFLELQSSLERLELSGSLLLESFFNCSADRFPFKLKYLNVNSKLVSNCNIDAGLMNFLGRHESSLQELILECPVRSSALKFVLHLSNLKALKLPVFDLSEEEAEFFVNLPRMSVKRLETYECFKTFSHAKLILDLFPLVEDLSMKNVSTINEFKDFPSFISNQFQNLKILHVHNLSCQVDMRRYKFDFLKEFDVAQLNKENHVEAFIIRHSATLEKLTIGWINDDEMTKKLAKNAIMQCTKLKYVSICSNRKVFATIFCDIAFSNHWTLEWSYKRYYYSPKTSQEFRYKFPDDLVSFEEKIKSLNDILKQELGNNDRNVFWSPAHDV